MRKWISFLAVLCLLAVAVPSRALPQSLTVDAEQVQSLMSGGKKAVLIDVRPAEEYSAGHIPGAINIPAERITADKHRLPRDKAVTLIFYCRGVG